jgi:hypothetical protein
MLSTVFVILIVMWMLGMVFAYRMRVQAISNVPPPAGSTIPEEAQLALCCYPEGVPFR